MKNFYLELREGEKVVKRQSTSLASEYEDRQSLKVFWQKEGQKIHFVLSTTIKSIF